MQTRIGLAFAAVLIAAAALTSQHVAPAAHAAPVARGEGQDSSTLDDQVELAVTVYNSDIALVRDVRELQLPRGTLRLCSSWTSPRRSIRRPCTSAR